MKKALTDKRLAKFGITRYSPSRYIVHIGNGVPDEEVQRSGILMEEVSLYTERDVAVLLIAAGQSSARRAVLRSLGLAHTR